jgi:DNA (cytosine-5)-methyltransferase 1
MEAMTKLPEYYVHVACPISTSIWLPQKRDRLIIIGSRGNFSWRAPQAKRSVTLAEILEPEPSPHIPDYVNRRLAGQYREYARLQGVPDTFTFAGGANNAYRMIGNGVSVPVGEWIGREIKRYFSTS